jgi:hypothetical protein
MSDQEKSFRRFISAMKIEEFGKKEGYEVIDTKDFDNETFIYLKRSDKK